MYNLKLTEAKKQNSSLKIDNMQSLFLRYIILYGSGPIHYITERKKIDFLDIFDYVKPEEYEMFKKNINEPTNEEKNIIKTFYIGTKNSWIINNKLRMGIELSKDEKILYNVLNKVCYENKCGKNCILRRYVDLNYLSQYNISFDKYDENSARKALSLIKEKLIYNINRKENGFMSASYGKHGFIDREVLLLIYCPFGIRMYVTDNDAETEVIFQNGMEYTFFDAFLEKQIEKGLSLYRIVLCCLLNGGDQMGDPFL